MGTAKSVILQDSGGTQMLPHTRVSLVHNAFVGKSSVKVGNIDANTDLSAYKDMESLIKAMFYAISVPTKTDPSDNLSVNYNSVKEYGKHKVKEFESLITFTHTHTQGTITCTKVGSSDSFDGVYIGTSNETATAATLDSSNTYKYSVGVTSTTPSISNGVWNNITIKSGTTGTWSAITSSSSSLREIVVKDSFDVQGTFSTYRTDPAGNNIYLRNTNNELVDTIVSKPTSNTTRNKTINTYLPFWGSTALSETEPSNKVPTDDERNAYNVLTAGTTTGTARDYSETNKLVTKKNEFYCVNPDQETCYLLLPSNITIDKVYVWDETVDPATYKTSDGIGKNPTNTSVYCKMYNNDIKEYKLWTINSTLGNASLKITIKRN